MTSRDADPATSDPETARRRAEARADAAELELERAHRLLDDVGVPRETRQAGERDFVELSLHRRIELVLEDAEEDGDDEDDA